MRRHFLVAILLFSIAPFGTTAAQAGFPTLRFDREPPYRLAVGSLDIVNRDPSPNVPPRIDRMFPVSPARAIERWAHDRLRPTGGSSRLVFTIIKARALDTKLPMRAGSLSDTATDQQSDRYDVIGEVRLDIVDPTGHVVATARAIATRYQTVLQSAPPEQLDGIWYDMVEHLMADLSPTLDREIAAHFARYLR